MISIRFPDGASRQYPAGTTAMEVAKSISEGLARKVLVARVNNKVVDAATTITEDAIIQFLTWDDADGKNTFWHSSAHLMAEAVESLFPGVKFWVGPALDKGFYYDMDLGDKKSPMMTFWP
ncbi:TGS domain-containing protein [Sediminibacterium salmoneum]|uniref:TGS domain-containing protein n=1 Tax=Sediminibacterium salmoneum TaxID=426421 RepID=UPI0004ACCF00|nr:TGS domain-containing protein [Sediminibacterium salmoneum]